MINLATHKINFLIIFLTPRIYAITLDRTEYDFVDSELIDLYVNLRSVCFLVSYTTNNPGSFVHRKRGGELLRLPLPTKSIQNNTI